MFAAYMLIAVFYIVHTHAVDLDSIAFPKKTHNFKEETHSFTFSVSSSGCVIDHATHAIGSIFTLPLTGPCMQYQCNQAGVKLLIGQSGCENDVKCSKNEFLIGHCTDHVCAISDMLAGNTITVRRHLKALGVQSCRQNMICHPVGVHFTVHYHHHTASCVCHDVDRFHCVQSK